MHNDLLLKFCKVFTRKTSGYSPFVSERERETCSVKWTVSFVTACHFALIGIEYLLFLIKMIKIVLCSFHLATRAMVVRVTSQRRDSLEL